MFSDRGVFNRKDGVSNDRLPLSTKNPNAHAQMVPPQQPYGSTSSTNHIVKIKRPLSKDPSGQMARMAAGS